MSMPLARMPFNAAVTFPVRRGQPNAAISAFNLDIKIGLLEFATLCEVVIATSWAYHDVHVICGTALDIHVLDTVSEGERLDTRMLKTVAHG